jgi:hypothetical protein
MVLLVGGKQTTDAAISVSGAGWAQLGIHSPTFVVAGVDVGSMKIGAWWKEHGVSETAPVPTVTNSDNAVAVIHSFSKTAGAWDTPVWAGGDDTGVDTAHSVAGLDVAVATGDMAITFSMFRSDAATPLVAVMGLTTPGITYAAGTKIPTTDFESTLAGDLGTTGSYRLANSGSSSGTSTISGTIAAAHTGSSELVVLSESSGATPKSLLFSRLPAKGLTMRGNR